MQCAQNGNVSRVKRILQWFPDSVDFRNEFGNTALLNASYYGQIDVVRVLIEAGANINAQNEDGYTPLLRASWRGYEDIVDLLLTAGADPHIPSKNGDTALKYGRGDIVKRLLRDAIAARPLIPVETPVLPLNPPVPPTPLDEPPHSQATTTSTPTIISIRDITMESAPIYTTASSTIYRGTYRTVDVAIKMIRSSGRVQTTDTHLAEIEILTNLRHPHILLLLGIVKDFDASHGFAGGLVTEYMPGGSLYDVLHDASSSLQLGLSQKIRVLRDVANGMRFLHESGVIHRDLKSPNVLLDANGLAKVCDFGISKLLVNDTNCCTTVSGTPAWSSPELMMGQEVRCSTDAYSFGVIMWEMMTGAVPWDGVNVFLIGIRISQGETLPLPHVSENCPEAIVTLMRACFDRDSASRPLFHHMFNVLNDLQILAKEQSHGSLPDAFACAISFELMNDPVICCDGYTYDRVNIERWLQTSRRSPMTNIELDNLTLIPNRALKEAIQQYLIS